MKIPVFIRIFAMLSSGLAFVCGNSFAQDSPSNPDQNSRYVGVEVCQGCHEDVYKSCPRGDVEKQESGDSRLRRLPRPGRGTCQRRRSRTYRTLWRRATRSDSGPLRMLSRIGNQPSPHPCSSQLLDVPLCASRLASQASARQAVAATLSRLPSREISARGSLKWQTSPCDARHVRR